MITEKPFKNAFRKVGFSNKEKLVDSLMEIFSKTQFHFLRYALFKYSDTFSLNPDVKNILSDSIKEGDFFVYDFYEPFQGGRELSNKDMGLRSFVAMTEEEQKEFDSKEEEFKNKIEDQFWNNKENISKYEAISSFDVYEIREPKSNKEKAMKIFDDFGINGGGHKKKSSLFNVNNILKYYQDIVSLFFPDFVLSKKLSSKTIKRFTKDIGNDLLLGLYLDLGFISGELKHMYFQFPSIKVELISKELESHVNERLYVVDQSEYPILRLSYMNHIGLGIHFRLGDSTESGEMYKRKSFFI